jgi:hypothetical protein
MWNVVAQLAIIGISYAYHRYQQNKAEREAVKPKAANQIEVPRTEDGAPIPIIYGRCRVREPWLAWTGVPEAVAGGGVGDPAHGAPFYYVMDTFYVVGIPIAGGTNVLRKVWVDDLPLANGFGANPAETESIMDNSANPDGPGHIGGKAQFYNGNSTQLFCEQLTPFTGLTTAGDKMATVVGGQNVPSYRGYLSAILYNSGGKWKLGNSTRPGAYSFEAISYPAVGLAQIIGEFGPTTAQQINDEANPADVLYDLLTGVFAKLGIPIAYIDLPSFHAAATTLYDELHGYSRAIEGGVGAYEIIDEILQQIDGVLRDNPTTGKIELKLIRPDYDPSGVFQLSPSNCDLEGYTPGTWDNVFNRCRVVFTDRSAAYKDESATAFNEANARSQLGNPDELKLRMRGVNTQELADTIAEREISIRSRPLATCRVRVNRSAVRLSVGDVCSLTWPKLGISNMFFRVSKCDRGTTQDGRITLHLLQEPYQLKSSGGVVFDVIDVPGIPAHR